MKLPEAIKRLSSLGFKMGVVDAVPFWGTIEAEPCDSGKDSFTPLYRDVFIGRAKGGWYITSHIKGTYRRYRCRNEQQVCRANIFGGGTTLEEALTEFVVHFNRRQK